MAKPTKSTEWATDGAALKTDPDAGQVSYGWSTSDNTINGVPVKPNLQQQNGWQNAVYQWIDWMDGQLPDNELTIVDLWRWDTCDTSSGKTGNYLDGFKESSGIAGALEMHYTDGAYVSSWASNKADILTGSRYHEVLDMFARGIGFQIVDASSVIWTVYPTGDWSGFNNVTDNGITQINLEANMDGTGGGPNYVQFDRLANANRMFTIQKNDGGTITNPDDFAGFSAITDANFLTYNPNGVRAVLVGNKNIDFSYTASAGNRLAIKDLKKRWIRTLCTGDNTILPNDGGSGIFKSNIPLEQGKAYRCRVFNFRKTALAPSAVTLGAGEWFVYSNEARNAFVFGDYQLRINNNNSYPVLNKEFDFTATDYRTDKLTIEGLLYNLNASGSGTSANLSNFAPRVIVEEY